jgi:ribA/ribD-fused uncharacterized protein
MIETFTTTENRFLSNFYPFKTPKGDKYEYEVNILYLHHLWPCVETAYQAAKFEDKIIVDEIYNMTPFQAKKFGDINKKFYRKNWDNLKYYFMENFVLKKFQGSENLKLMLLKTGDQELQEGNTWGDTYWGRVKDIDGNWVGQNNLGKIIIDVREYLQNQRV